MQALLKKAQRIAAETADTMLSGEIGVQPTEHACDFCDFRSVCRFDSKLASCRVRRIPSVKQDAFFEQLKQDSRGKDREEGADHGDALD